MKHSTITLLALLPLGCVSQTSVSDPVNIPSCAVEGALLFTVGDTDDLVDADLTDDLCESSAGTCTLRAAIEQANATDAPFTHITVASGDYQLSIPAGTPDPTCEDDTCMIEDESDAAMGDLDIHVAMCVEGRDRDNTVIRGGGDVGRVFHLHETASSPVFSGVVIKNVTLSDGYAPAFSGDDPIENLVVMTGCESGEDECSGGAIRNQSSAYLQNIVVSDNASNGQGNGILNSAEMILSASEVNNNRDELGHGGGLYNQQSLTVQYSTFDGNRTDSSGGAIANMGGTVDIVHSTFHANETPWEGSAISMGGGGEITILFTTIAGSNSPNDGAAIAIYAGTVTIKNSIVADTNGDNCLVSGGTLIAEGDNLSTDATCTDFTLSEPAGLQAISAADCLASGTPDMVCTPVLTPEATSLAVEGATDCTDWDGTAADVDQQGQERLPGEPCELGSDEI